MIREWQAPLRAEAFMHSEQIGAVSRSLFSRTSLSKLGDQLRLWQAALMCYQKRFEALRSCGRSGLHDDVGARAFDDCL